MHSEPWECTKRCYLQKIKNKKNKLSRERSRATLPPARPAPHPKATQGHFASNVLFFFVNSNAFHYSGVEGGVIGGRRFQSFRVPDSQSRRLPDFQTPGLPEQEEDEEEREDEDEEKEYEQ